MKNFINPNTLTKAFYIVFTLFIAWFITIFFLPLKLIIYLFLTIVGLLLTLLVIGIFYDLFNTPRNNDIYDDDNPDNTHLLN